MHGILKFTEDSPYKGEIRHLTNITEIHYLYPSSLEPSTAFESDIDGTGFTVFNKWIKEFEIKN